MECARTAGHRGFEPPHQAQQVHDNSLQCLELKHEACRRILFFLLGR